MNEEEIDELTRLAVQSALRVLDIAIPTGKQSAGPLGDALATTLHQAIEKALQEHLTKPQAPPVRQVYHANPPEACAVCRAKITTGFSDALVPFAGCWGDVCPTCVSYYNIKHGTGRGQRYEKQTDGRFLKVEG